MDDIKKPEEQAQAAPQELTESDLAQTVGGDQSTSASKVTQSDVAFAYS